MMNSKFAKPQKVLFFFSLFAFCPPPPDPVSSYYYDTRASVCKSGSNLHSFSCFGGGVTLILSAIHFNTLLIDAAEWWACGRMFKCISVLYRIWLIDDDHSEWVSNAFVLLIYNHINYNIATSMTTSEINKIKHHIDISYALSYYIHCWCAHDIIPAVSWTTSSQHWATPVASLQLVAQRRLCAILVRGQTNVTTYHLNFNMASLILIVSFL